MQIVNMDINRDFFVPIKNDDSSVVIQDNMILLQNRTTQECILVPLTQDIVTEFELEIEQQEGGVSSLEEFPDEENEPTDEGQGKDTKLWTRDNTLFLIEIIKKYDEQFSTGVKKNVWKKVAQECKHLHKNINEKQCEIKWKTLKRTYKSVVLNNNTSGMKNRYWEYYKVMHEIMYKKPEIAPVAVCSSMRGLQVNKGDCEYPIITFSNKYNILDATNSPIASCSSSSKEDGSLSEGGDSSFLKKRKLRVSEIEKRHQDKMKRLDRFNDLFEEMVKKM